ncbi:unnamed protein product [Rotaria sp. Silwood2]|nr:unnamed protein product [Rotaria sp. Silwood2]
MDKTKRRLTYNGFYDNKVQKVRHHLNDDQNTLLITSIENLSNEFFYELFDYLDGCNIFKAFSNLNHRFQQLLNSSSLIFKLELNTLTNESMNIYKKSLIINRHKILSINFSLTFDIDIFYSLFPIDSSLTHLGSLVFERINTNVLISILAKLNSLPRLFSIKIGTCWTLKELSIVYQLILALSMLKYYKLSSYNIDLTNSLPMIANKQFSPIKYLLMDHCSTFKELSAILSYTPQLCHLNFMQTKKLHPNTDIISPITLSNLKHLSIHAHHLKFDEFEIFISQISSTLKVLFLSTESEDINYLDAILWEQLILKYMPQIEKFDLRYYETIYEDFESPTYFNEPHHFSTSFWIERQWIFEAEISGSAIIYAIRPYKKRWYEYMEDDIDKSSIEFSESIRLSITYNLLEESYESLIMDINRVLNVTLIHHLQTPTDTISIDLLIQIILLLPQLNSLKMNSLSLDQSTNAHSKEMTMLYSGSKKCKITKFYLEMMDDIEEIYVLMTLCPYLAYFKLNSLYDMDAQLFLRNILAKITDGYNDQLRSIYFQVPAADDVMVKRFKKMIDDEKLLNNYTIKRVVDHIHLKVK